MAATTTVISPRNTPGSPLPTDTRRSRFLASTIPITQGGSVTTYYYRTAAGASGSATTVGDIPAGAVVERTVVS